MGARKKDIAWWCKWEFKEGKKTTYVNVDKAVLEWFKSARTRNLPISGGLLKEKALEFSQKLEQPNFKASTGWLDNWKRRSGICHKKACGESNDVSEEDCMKWQRDVLPHLLEGYQARDVFNADETGLFFKCLPDNTLTFKNQKCHGGKHSKQRVTLMIAANMDGSEKFKILLIDFEAICTGLGYTLMALVDSATHPIPRLERLEKKLFSCSQPSLTPPKIS
ncbi:tigger transposable element-derived protein 4-like [Anastrepha obliqua]|uniref:tigger transposable element-derived protein 4-like n=1 Tax=Anastrepha obliqua TaxID=95512 RepID=UPI00240A0DC6|nr:tigger transposable element-derived protein 4-like [Anastrepha obliqua]